MMIVIMMMVMMIMNISCRVISSLAGEKHLSCVSFRPKKKRTKPFRRRHASSQPMVLSHHGVQSPPHVTYFRHSSAVSEK